MFAWYYYDPEIEIPVCYTGPQIQKKSMQFHEKSRLNPQTVHRIPWTITVCNMAHTSGKSRRKSMGVLWESGGSPWRVRGEYMEGPWTVCTDLSFMYMTWWYIYHF